MQCDDTLTPILVTLVQKSLLFYKYGCPKILKFNKILLFEIFLLDLFNSEGIKYFMLFT